MPPLEAVIETAIYATDLAAAESFYAGVLGLPVMGREAGRHVFFRDFSLEATTSGRGLGR